MQLYRFSPIESKDELMGAVEYIHRASHKLSNMAFGEYLPVSGNVGVFCHYDSEYEFLKNLTTDMVQPSDNPDQKYFPLTDPINFEETSVYPEATYTHLYIRRPDPYRHHVGDIDFLVDDEKYAKLKELAESDALANARAFNSPTLDMIELYDPDVDVLAYVTTKETADKVQSTKSQTY